MSRIVRVRPYNRTGRKGSAVGGYSRVARPKAFKRPFRTVRYKYVVVRKIDSYGRLVAVRRKVRA